MSDPLDKFVLDPNKIGNTGQASSILKFLRLKFPILGLIQVSTNQIKELQKNRD